MPIRRSFQVIGALLVFLPLFTSQSNAAPSCEPVVGRLVTIEGQVQVQRTGAGSWLKGELNSHLCKGDTVRAGERSRATVALINQAVLRIDRNTAMRLDNISGVTEERSVLSLLKGAFQSFSRKPRGFEVSTPYLNGSIEGTEFVFRVQDDESILTVFEGTVLASNAQGSASVSGGESVAAKAGQAPQARTVVRPRDAAQWSLYYPPILATGSGQGTSPALRQAADDLSVGRVDEARSGVEQAIAAGGADAGLAYALRAVINVVQNEPDQALADAQQGVSLSPDSTAAKIALSYAQQANFQINEARDTLQAAVAQQPQAALAHARLAELQLMLGDRKQASASAQTAVGLAPDLGRTQITLGFAALAEFRNEEARAAFEKAIELDSADPLPHLGLGLSRISDGELEAGRQELEVAVGLDSNNALLRSYLGKAYFEEKRGPLDSEQFEIAKQLDLNDPTPYLYSGIAKQTENRPVEAARDLEKSIELNDNRAAYRGRLLLDKDRAARGTSLARAFNDLGFSQLGVNESTRSLTLDPANDSAHRFLSDTYRDLRRREIARVSELFQAQMMQENNINPVQPSVSSTNLNIVTSGGPADAGFNEFTPLFERNETRFNVSGFGGSNDTIGGEATVTGLYDRYSVSAGAFYYDTDGFRDNTEVRHEIYNLFGQAAISPTVNLQAELRHRDSENGDLDMNFDPDAFDPSFHREFEEDTARIGVRFTPNPATNILFSAIYSDRENEVISDVGETVITVPVFPPPPLPPIPTFVDVTNGTASFFDTYETSQQYEAQYLYQGLNYNITAGATYAEVDQEFRKLDELTFNPPGIIGPPSGLISNLQIDEPTVKDTRAYVYGNVFMLDQITWTLGMSYHDYDQGDIDFDRFNPKLGFQWDVSDSLKARAAYFKVVKPALASNRTLEPTQVAGFNQYFDDTNATRSERYGAALDWAVRDDFSVGAEFSRRELVTPEFLFTTTTNRDVFYLDWDEWTHRAYAYWTPTNRWSLSAEAVYDKFEGDEDTFRTNSPMTLKTTSFPVRAQYFHPNGFFAGIGVTYVDQEVDRLPAATLLEGDSDFAVGDISIGYRFPRRLGIASISIQNVTDEEFEYQDDSFREFQDEPSTGPYYPERIIMGRITLNF